MQDIHIELGKKHKDCTTTTTSKNQTKDTGSSHNNK